MRASIASSVNVLLDDPSLRRATERRAYRFGRQMTWPHVAREYGKLFVELGPPGELRVSDLRVERRRVARRSRRSITC